MMSLLQSNCLKNTDDAFSNDKGKFLFGLTMKYVSLILNLAFLLVIIGYTTDWWLELQCTTKSVRWVEEESKLNQS